MLEQNIIKVPQLLLHRLFSEQFNPNYEGIPITLHQMPDRLRLHYLTHLALPINPAREQQLIILPLVACYGVTLQRKLDAPTPLSEILHLMQCLPGPNIRLLVLYRRIQAG